MSNLDSCTTFFSNYEDREDAFRTSVDFKLARRYGGPALFWKDFRQISSNASTAQEREVVCSITSNPRDCLAFATANQVLTAALMSTGRWRDENQIADIASRFTIAEQLSQPIRTLSGGESVKLALAKTCLSIPTCEKIVISSPFAWLSSANHHLLEYVIEQGHSDGKEVSILALDGENNLSPAKEDDLFIGSTKERLPFSLKMSDVKIPLTLSLNPLTDTEPCATIDDTCLELDSPCLLKGENGQGKSLVARALAGSLALKGKASIKGADTEGKASLLFQDVQTQTLLRSFSVIAGSSRGASRSAVLELYTGLTETYHSLLNDKSNEAPSSIKETGEKPQTMLNVKAILVPARLAASPAALILDEPDWGLSRKSSIAFVSSVLSAAHERGTPVLLISHKPWWQPLLRSCLAVERTVTATDVSAADPVFNISLRNEVVSG